MATQWIELQHMTNRVGQSIKRHSQVHRLRRKAHPHCARQQDHDALVSSTIIATVQLGDAPVTSTTIPFGSRSSTVAAVETIVAGASRRGALTPWARAYAAIVSPLCRQLSSAVRASSSVHSLVASPSR